MKNIIIMFAILIACISCTEQNPITEDSANFDPVKVVNGIWNITTEKNGTTQTMITATKDELYDGMWRYEGCWSGNTFKGGYKKPPYDAYISVTVISTNELSGFMSLKITIPGASKYTSDNFTGIKVK